MSLAQKLRRARARYMQNPTARGLRYYLRLKAKSGKWDDRYALYHDVPTHVTPAVKRFITRGFAEGLVPTATTNGVHAAHSYHKFRPGRAADLGVRRDEVGTAKGRKRMVRFQTAEFRRRGRTKPIELIGPHNNLIILKGRHQPLPEHAPLEDQHDNHVHGAF